MFIPDPDFYPSWISDPGFQIQTQQQKREVKKKNCCSHKFHKIKNYCIFEMPKKIIWASFQRIIELVTQKFFTKLSKIWIWDPRSGKNLFRIPDPGPGVKKTPDPGSRSTTLLFSRNVSLASGSECLSSFSSSPAPTACKGCLFSGNAPQASEANLPLSTLMLLLSSTRHLKRLSL